MHKDSSPLSGTLFSHVVGGHFLNKALKTCGSMGELALGRGGERDGTAAVERSEPAEKRRTTARGNKATVFSSFFSALPFSKDQ